MRCTRCMSQTDVIESREAQKAGPGQRRAVKRAMGELATSPIPISAVVRQEAPAWRTITSPT